MLYYSNDILSKTLPELGPYVSLGITVVNVFMTFAPIFLIDVRTKIPFIRDSPRLISDCAAHGAEEAPLPLRHRRDPLARCSRIWARQRRRHACEPRGHDVHRVCIIFARSFASGRLAYSDTSRRSFAIGIGPVPFVMIPEVSPHQVRPRPSSLWPRSSPPQTISFYAIAGGLCTVVHRTLAQLYVPCLPPVPLPEAS